MSFGHRKKEPLTGGTDPRQAGGTFAGPGGPHDRNGVVIDATNAVLLDDVHVALVEGWRDGVRLDNHVVALKLEGRINKTKERSEIVYMFDEDGAAAIVSELIALATRAGFGPHFMNRLDERMRTITEEGH